MTKRQQLGIAIVLVLAVFLCAGTTVINLTTQVTGVLPAANGGVPSGMIGFVDTGTCPTGWTEQAFSGKYVVMTVAANADVGGTGGSTSYTPAGTIATATMAATGTKFTTSSSGTAALTALAGTTIASGTGNTVTEPARTFTGTAATIQMPYVKLIACQKD